MVESRRHAEILNKIIESLKNRTDNYEIHSSHGRIDGDFLIANGQSENFIEVLKPDLAICKNNRLLFIEIELSNSPKKIIGDAGAIDISNYCRLNNNWHKLPDDKSLLIVLAQTSLDRTGRRKRNQLDRLREIIRSRFNLTSFDIVTDEKVMQSIDNWLDTGRLQ